MSSFTWTDRGVREALGLPASDEAGLDAPVYGGVSTDTRTLAPGDLFVALVGPRFDGHAFLEDARARGARGAVVSRADQAPEGLVLYEVADTLVALGALASHRRRRLPARVVGITGSSGKTTVKDLLAAGLAPSFRVHATPENLNNRIGVPLTLLAAPADADVVVVEMGTNEAGEIAILADIAEPDASLVTTVGASHLTGLGSLEGVMEEKLDLVRGTAEEGPVIVGDEPAELPKRARSVRSGVRVAGLTERADPEDRGELGEADEAGRYRVRFAGREIRAGLPGRHGATNLVLTLAMIRALGGDRDAGGRAAATVTSGALRGEVRRIGNLTLLLDCYNANPQSTIAALEWLAELPAEGGRVAVLASMLELGDRAPGLHAAVLDHARSLPLDVIVAVDAFAEAASATEASAPGPEVIPAATAGEAYAELRGRLRGSETVLLKGSRGTALEELVPRFVEDFGGEAA